MDSSEPTQTSVAARFGVEASPPLEGERIGISDNVRRRAVLPLNAVRHLPVGSMSGWYVWRGELEDRDDFFSPLHVEHIEDWCPEIVPYLELPPGYGVVLAPGYEDVWFDPELLVH